MPTPAPITRAYVNWGRWILECQCGNAVQASDEANPDHVKLGVAKWRCVPFAPHHSKTGFCGAAYHVGWPDTDRIMAILAARPRRNQNWIPGEKIADLVAENIEHGIAVPEGETGA